MHILWVIVAGLVIGALARLLLRGRQPIPLWLTLVLGILGGVAGNRVATALGVRYTPGIDWIRHALQVGAAMVMIALVTPFYLGRRNRSVR